mgnify:CR=1 FL=1
MTPHRCAQLPVPDVRDPHPPRLGGTQGSGLVAAVTLIFAFTFLGLVWLARDVDRGVSNRSAAQSIAFQAARSGAQSASIPDLRRQRGVAVAIDAERAASAARLTAAELFASYELQGLVTSVVVSGDRVSVTVRVTENGVTATGTGIVRAERAP